MHKTQVWAHRGASAYAPENTMPAFLLAAQMGADGIEIDIHLTKDEEVVICHDDRLERVSNGVGMIYEKTLAQLLELDFSSGLEGFGGTRIVTLGEFYAFAAQNNLFVNTELKYADSRWEKTNQKAVDIAREYGMTQRVLYSSFQFEPLLQIRKLEKAAKVGLLYKDPIPAPWETAKSLGARALHPYYQRIAEQDMAACCKANGILLHPWTVDEPEALHAMFCCGVDAVITNKPDVAIEIRNHIEGK